MDWQLIATWIGIVLLLILNVVGWFMSYSKYSRNEAMHLGELKGTVEGLGGRIGSLETRINSMEERLNTFISK